MRDPLRPGWALTRRDIGDLLGVSRQRVYELADRADFPRPYCLVDDDTKPIWRRADVELWAKQTGRLDA